MNIDGKPDLAVPVVMDTWWDHDVHLYSQSLLEVVNIHTDLPNYSTHSEWEYQYQASVVGWTQIISKYGSLWWP